MEKIDAVTNLSREIWNKRCDGKYYWKDIKRMKYNYYYLNHESCFPQRTVLHSFYTCFIATASNLLQIALSYIEIKQMKKSNYINY